jgi:hypothetical protein
MQGLEGYVHLFLVDGTGIDTSTTTYTVKRDVVWFL